MMDSLLNVSILINLLDIVLTAYVIYRVMLLLNGTLSKRFYQALALLLCVSVLTRFAGLKALNLVADICLCSLIIIFVVVFQHDIRRALGTTKKNRFLETGPEEGQGEVHEIINELASAVESIAQRKIGALIVIECEMPLKNFIVVGTELDAKVTSELITSIFLPYSPIHDGAVIIQRGKLTKAGCFLPLTQNAAISKELGTRHRAAIGLSEVVDAVIVVVSEETGTISLVTGGVITTGLDSAGLKKLLEHNLDLRWLA
jgi:diadenylate cyclase